MIENDPIINIIKEKQSKVQEDNKLIKKKKKFSLFFSITTIIIGLSILIGIIRSL